MEVLETEGGGGIVYFEASKMYKRLTSNNLIPDSSLLDETDLETMPPSLQYIVCDGKVETGSPCNEHKWNTTDYCTLSKFQVSWHPGWKIQQLTGKMIAYFMIESLQAALEELHEMIHPNEANATDSTNVRARSLGDEPTSTKALTDTYRDIRERLQSRDKVDFELFLNSSLAQFDLGEHNKGVGPVKNTTLDIIQQSIYRGNAVCTTTLLPADSRYRGIMTETGHVGTYLNEQYDLGSPYRSRAVPNVPATYEHPTSPFHMVYVPGDRRSGSCVNGTGYEIDFKDYYAVRYGEGWFTETFPKKSMIAAYGHERDGGSDAGAKAKNSNRGLILVCTIYCPFGNCPKGTVSLEEIGPSLNETNGGNVTIRVDGKEVVAVEKYDTCYILVNEDGLQFGPRDQYDISIIVNQPGGTVQITSIIIM
eukprot:CAMPEP_0171307362 /NCGR_PEP_ID=MMETSP0816-20121228/17382_1 /TAXON_ID=420281 /ORGANISM="Proboscia inermis, Strain CCAP1064/1" /LENGTH=421 /DNA_ID=CAMNT_0011789479 /DNA_START=14 /DNA_END=1279 /DNA_ORIENTATION=+